MSRKIVTNKQQTILTLLLTFRFLNSKQIQEFLVHKDHRRINGWLKDMVDKEYIERDFKQIYGVLTKPAVYWLTGKGRKQLKHSYQYSFPKYLRRISRDSKSSKGFRIKCQIIGDWYLLVFPPGENKAILIVDNLVKELTTNIVEEKKIIPLNTLEFFTPSYYPNFILLEKIKPDAYVRKRTSTGLNHLLLFVLDAYIPKLMLQYFLKKIFTALKEEYWETENIETLQIYVLCPNNMVIIYLRRLLKSFLKSYYGNKELVLNFATRNQLYKRKKVGSGDTGWITISSEDEFAD